MYDTIHKHVHRTSMTSSSSPAVSTIDLPCCVYLYVHICTFIGIYKYPGRMDACVYYPVLCTVFTFLFFFHFSFISNFPLTLLWTANLSYLILSYFFLSYLILSYATIPDGESHHVAMAKLFLAVFQTVSFPTRWWILSYLLNQSKPQPISRTYYIYVSSAG